MDIIKGVIDKVASRKLAVTAVADAAATGCGRDQQYIIYSRAN
jgi:hypothetical protein